MLKRVLKALGAGFLQVMIILPFMAVPDPGVYAGSGSPDARNLRLSLMFSDNMVLQRNMETPVWGWAEPGGVVAVEFNGQNLRAVAGEDGRWDARFEPMQAGGPFVMTVSGESRIELKNVLIGDVWLCSGQSNMAWRLRQSKNARQEIAGADYPEIRLFTVPPTTNQSLQKHLPTETGGWQECSPRTAADYSAVGYFFGRELLNTNGVPVGLIQSAVGGTGIELWISRACLEKEPAAEDIVERFQRQMDDPDLEEKIKAHREMHEKRLRYRNEEVSNYSPEDWTRPGYDSREWETFDTSSPGVAGGRWLALMNIRKIVEIPEKWEGKELTVHVWYPMVFGYNRLFFNGNHAGRVTGHGPSHNFKRYSVPGKFVKPGKAVIAERLFDYQYETSFLEGRGRSFLTAEGSDIKVKLSGVWEIEILDKFKLVREPMHAGHMKALNGLYNAMIRPVIPFGIKGVIWYQGESNVADAWRYGKLQSLLIKSWRRNWRQGDFPFLMVQIANFGRSVDEPGDSARAELREAQAESAAEVPNCEMIVTIDIGDAGNVHPLNKQDVGARLALAARKAAYGEDIVYSGPVYKSMSKEDGRIILEFEHAGGGLVTKDGELRQFAVAGKDRNFVWADAVIVGDTVVVSSRHVPHPAAVRYAWADNPEGCNLYNKEGLPAVPFRTDTWSYSSR